MFGKGPDSGANDGKRIENTTFTVKGFKWHRELTPKEVTDIKSLVTTHENIEMDVRPRKVRHMRRLTKTK